MSAITKLYRLDAWKSNYVTFYVVQGEVESRVFQLELLNSQTPVDLRNKTVLFFAKKPDGNPVYVSCVVSNAAKGIVDFSVPQQLTTVYGTFPCWIQVIDTDGTDLRFAGMSVCVDDCSMNSDLESSEELRVFAEKAAKVDAILADAENIPAAIKKAEDAAARAEQATAGLKDPEQTVIPNSRNPVSGGAVAEYAQSKVVVSTIDLEEGISSLATGQLYAVYDVVT